MRNNFFFINKKFTQKYIIGLFLYQFILYNTTTIHLFNMYNNALIYIYVNMYWFWPIFFYFILGKITDLDKKFHCGQCGKTYKHQASLYNHQTYECGKAPQFTCPYCPYRAKQKINLRSHLYTKHHAVTSVNGTTSVIANN